jgi:hypothetical protein
MALRRLAILAILAVLASFPLAADTIYPEQSTITLNTGDSLAFTFTEASYAANAARYGASASPVSLSFALITSELSGVFNFSATILAYDDSAEIPFGNEAVTEGRFTGTYYKGAVSVASGSVRLSAADSAAIFTSSRAVLVLENTGAAVTLGLAPYTLAQDMQITLTGLTQSGSSLSVGGLVSSVSLERAQPSAVLLTNNSLSTLESSGTDAPEPQSWVLIAAGAGAMLLMRRRRR